MEKQDVIKIILNKIQEQRRDFLSNLESTADKDLSNFITGQLAGMNTTIGIIMEVLGEREYQRLCSK